MSWVLIWNPEDYDWVAEGFQGQFAQFASTGFLDSRWSCGWIHSQGNTGPKPGGRFFQFRVGRSHPGLVGAGRFLESPRHEHGEFNGAPMALIRYEYLADVRDPQTYLPRPTLRLLTGDTLRYQASGMPMPLDIAARLELVLGLMRSVAALAA